MLIHRNQRRFLFLAWLSFSAGLLYILSNITFLKKISDSFMKENYVTDKWIKLNPNVNIFSAYYDQRNDNALYGKIQIMGFVNESYDATIYCKFMYVNRTLCLEKSPMKTFLRQNQHHSAIMYSCLLPSVQIPVAVTLVIDEQCASTITTDENFTKVNYQRWVPVKEFGVCVHSPMFNMNNPQFVAEYIEMNRFLGAEWFTSYIESASTLVWSLLKSYESSGLVEAIEWGINLPSSRYKGQDLSIQDCLYRNMYKVKYLLYVDLDELIFPHKHPNWHKMMEELDSPDTAMFYFQHLALFQNENDPNIKKIYHQYANCSQRDAVRQLSVPRYLSYTLQSTKVFEKKRKIMVKVLAIRSLRVHRVTGAYGKQVYVNVELASMCHFRSGGLDGFKESSVYFDKVQALVPKLFANLKSRLCNLK